MEGLGKWSHCAKQFFPTSTCESALLSCSQDNAPEGPFFALEKQFQMTPPFHIRLKPCASCHSRSVNEACHYAQVLHVAGHLHCRVSNRCLRGCNTEYDAVQEIRPALDLLESNCTGSYVLPQVCQVASSRLESHHGSPHVSATWYLRCLKDLSTKHMYPYQRTCMHIVEPHLSSIRPTTALVHRIPTIWGACFTFETTQLVRICT